MSCSSLTLLRLAQMGHSVDEITFSAGSLAATNVPISRGLLTASCAANRTSRQAHATGTDRPARKLLARHYLSPSSSRSRLLASRCHRDREHMTCTIGMPPRSAPRRSGQPLRAKKTLESEPRQGSSFGWIDAMIYLPPIPRRRSQNGNRDVRGASTSDRPLVDAY